MSPALRRKTPLNRTLVASTLTGELVEFFGRDEPEAQDQTAAKEGTWQWPHIWTLAHAEVR
jgi:hypothetical protein